MLVLLIHGLGRTPLSLFRLAAALRRDGHRTRFFAYSPTLEKWPRIVRRLNFLLRDLAHRGKPIGLIAHSLGGILLRYALAAVPDLLVHHFVMLATPNRPPRMARIASRFLLFRCFARDCGRFLATTTGYPDPPSLGVAHTAIAGTAGPRGRYSPFGDEPNDGLVSVSEAALDDTSPVVREPVLHTFMMDAPAVRARISAIMNSG